MHSALHLEHRGTCGHRLLRSAFVALAWLIGCADFDDQDPPIDAGPGTACEPDAAECGEGFACEASEVSEASEEEDRGAYFCSTVCDDRLCKPGRECRADGRRCFTPDNCGYYVPCADDASVCDPAADRCIPRNGDCSSVTCPRFGEDVQAIARIECLPSIQVCSLSRRPLFVEFWTESATGHIRLRRPDPQHGTVFEQAADVRFEWDRQRASVLLRVLSMVPTSIKDYEAKVIWGASLPAGEPAELSWNQGFERSGGDWLPQPPSPLPEGVYYFSMIAVDAGTRVAVSDIVPFRVGQRWLQDGDRCDAKGTPGDCVSPTGALSCYDGICRRLCASHQDCGSDRCGDTTEGFRMCGVDVR